MRIAVDFDGTLVEEGHAYDDLAAPLRLKRGALAALRALKAAGHIIIVSSGRSNLALREDWRLNPLWVSGAVRFDVQTWARNLEVNRARYSQMVSFCSDELAGLVDAVDDGRQGKLMADLFIDDRAISYGVGARSFRWVMIAERYGEHRDGADDVG